MSYANPEHTEAEILDLLEAIEGRPITVHLARAHERRLQAHLIRCYADGFPPDGSDDHELEVALLATSDRGLHDGEDDAGVWSDVAGRECPLPRHVRAPWRRRLWFAWRAARTSWRAS